MLRRRDAPSQWPSLRERGLSHPPAAHATARRRTTLCLFCASWLPTRGSISPRSAPPLSHLHLAPPHPSSYARAALSLPPPLPPPPPPTTTTHELEIHVALGRACAPLGRLHRARRHRPRHRPRHRRREGGHRHAVRHPPVDDRLGRLAERRTGHVARDARVLHASMLRATLLPSMHFFDTTPVGLQERVLRTSTAAH